MASANTLQQPKSTLASATKLQQPKLTPSGKHIQSHILHVISKSNPSGRYMHSLILHVISKSHPLWQVHAQSHLTRHIKIPPPLASTCTVTSDITGSKSHPLWQAHARSHLTRHIKIPPPLAGTCTVSSYTSCQNHTPSGKYMHGLIVHVKSKSWQVHAQSHLTRHIKISPPLASTCTVSSYTSYQNPTPSGKYMHSLILHVMHKTPSGKHIQSHILRFI